MKDWTGNKTAVTSTLGASNLTDKKRADWDYYATPSKAIYPVLEYLEKDIPVWECAVGEGNLSKELKKNNYKVRESDIVIRSYKDIEQINFLNYNGEWDGNILTNPPFAFAKEFVEKGMSLLKEKRKLILYLRIQFLESKKRYYMFQKYPPKYILIYPIQNPQCARNGDFSKSTGNASMYAWFVWEKGFCEDTIIKWIPLSFLESLNKIKKEINNQIKMF